jgi:hypothetical protein
MTGIAAVAGGVGVGVAILLVGSSHHRRHAPGHGVAVAQRAAATRAGSAGATTTAGRASGIQTQTATTTGITSTETATSPTTESTSMTVRSTTTRASLADPTRQATSDAAVVGDTLQPYDTRAFVATPLRELPLHTTSNAPTQSTREWLGGPDATIEERVDMSPAGSLTPAQMAAPQLKTHAHQPGYQLVSAGPGGLKTHPSSFQWVFTYRGDSYVDWFFSECSHSFAVLGVSPHADFVKYFPVFTDFVNSVQARCG